MCSSRVSRAFRRVSSRFPSPGPRPNSRARARRSGRSEQCRAHSQRPSAGLGRGRKTRPGRPALTARAFLNELKIGVMLPGLKQGGVMREYRYEGPFTLQTLGGNVRVRLLDRVVELPAGRLLVVAPGAVHDIQATQASTCLLTLVKPWAMQQFQSPRTHAPAARKDTTR